MDAEKQKLPADNRRLAEANRRLRTRVKQLQEALRTRETAGGGLEEKISSLQATVRGLQEQVQVLTKALEEARRAGKHQAAPFGKGRRTKDPRKPGRKPGKDYGEHARRAAPQDAPIHEEHDAALPPECPKCGWQHLEEDQPPSVYDRFTEAIRQQCTAHLLRRCQELLEGDEKGVILGRA